MPEREQSTTEEVAEKLEKAERDKRTDGAEAGEKSTRDEGKRAKPIGGEKNRPDVGSGGA